MDVSGDGKVTLVDALMVINRLIEQDVPVRFLYWEKQPQNRGGRPPWSVAVRWGRWKALRNKPNLPLELYDLETDVAEQNNLADAMPEKVSKLRGMLREWRKEVDAQMNALNPDYSPDLGI